MKSSIRLAQGLAIRDGRVLLVASLYPSHPRPLWNLPGGRVEAGELLVETVVRETREETALRARAGELAYVSESYDGEMHVVTTVFHLEVDGEIALPRGNDHVSEVAWHSIDTLSEVITVRVVREPLLRFLRDGTRYHGTHDAGISVRWGPEG